MTDQAKPEATPSSSAAPIGKYAARTSEAKYVVMIDGSELSNQAAKLCATICQPEDVVILYNNFMSPYYFGHVSFPTKDDFDQHKKMILDAAQFFKGTDAKLYRKVEGAPDCRHSMKEFLEEQKPDCVFMGNRGFGNIKGAMGSSSQYVLHHYEKEAICLVRGFPSGKDGDITKPLHYMICVDGSEQSNRAVQKLAKTVKTTDKVSLFVAEQAPPQYVEEAGTTPVVAIGGGVWTHWVPKKNPNYQKEKAEAVDRATKCADDAKAEIQKIHAEFNNFQTVAAVVNDPKAAVERWAKDEANGVDVIVMGTRGRGLMKRLVLGSFSNHVLHHIEDKAFLIVH